MPDIQKLIDNNARWADEKLRQDPEFFNKLSTEQKPQYLWIGCSDSRVPANQITGLLPGEIFVHRNIANLVMQTDTNCQSVLQYAIEELQVKHIIVCGHYGCGGVAKAMSNSQAQIPNEKDPDMMDTWVEQITEINAQNTPSLAHLSKEERFSRLCELNALEQAKNVIKSEAFQRAIDKGQSIQVHSWVYDLKTGKINVLDRYHS
ncbi:MAG: carbonic anhydrase, partial [Pseudomonadota bacterium]